MKAPKRCVHMMWIPLLVLITLTGDTRVARAGDFVPCTDRRERALGCGQNLGVPKNLSVIKESIGATELEALENLAKAEWQADGVVCNRICRPFEDGGPTRCKQRLEIGAVLEFLEELRCEQARDVWGCSLPGVVQDGGTVYCAGCTGPPPVAEANIVAVHSDKCLDVRLASLDDGAAVQQFDCNEQRNQLWSLAFGVNGYATISAVHSRKCLGVRLASQERGADVEQFACRGHTSQEWSLWPLGGGDVFNLEAHHSAMCLDVRERSTENGARVQQWTGTGERNQQWRILWRKDPGPGGTK